MRIPVCLRLLLLTACTLLMLSAPAAASAATPGWLVSSDSQPTNLPPGGTGKLNVYVYNIGVAASSGTVTLVDTLPAGVTATSIEQPSLEGVYLDAWTCSGVTVVTCTTSHSFPREEAGEGQSGIVISVAVSKTASGVNTVRLSGGGASRAAVETRPQTFSSSPAAFGFQNFQQLFVNEDGTPDTQAGSHPYESVTAFSLNTTTEGEKVAGTDMRDLEVDLPPGLIGDPHATPLCPRTVFDERFQTTLSVPNCPADTQIGVESVYLGGLGLDAANLPVYNLVPPAGYPAQFGFAAGEKVGFIDVGVQQGANDAVKLFLRELPEIKQFRNVLTLWGVPASPSHTPFRTAPGQAHEGGASSENGALKPFISLPTSCGGALSMGVRASSWAIPSEALTSEEFTKSYPVTDAYGDQVETTGCDTLEFNPSASIGPETTKADTPTGLTAEVKVPASGLENPEGNSGADIQSTSVTLPAGVAINPGQAAGLQACQPEQAALGKEEGTAGKAVPVSCPAASKVGTVAIKTPLLEDELEGSIYILPSNPPNLQLLLAASADGVTVKLVGNVHLDPLNGQLTTTFEGTPQLPFTDLKLTFSSGPQAALVTPDTCGTYQSTAEFTPWSAPSELNVLSTSSFLIDEGPGGSPGECGSLPFSPVLTAGSTTDQAGGYTDFSLLLQRGDGQQRISRLQFKTPAGLLGMISKVPLCDEADANAGTCPSSSQIGHTVVTAGPGPDPLVVPEPGQAPAPIYLTGGYGGEPYGLSIVVPLHVGPFTLETQVVRASIAVDPYTAQLTITTNPLPSIIDGIPTDLRTINAVIDREGFMFNPTNCSPQAFSGTALSTEGATAAISSHFQVGSCQSLKFAPDFKVATQAKTSKADGASLEAKIVYPTGTPEANQASSQANVASVKVDLPKQLPSRLTTLQKACLAKVFEANPADCPADSVVGHATAISPILPVPVSGPAYFVSHGGEAFPSLILVLQGYGVTVDLVGTTYISHAGITSSTFKQVPDVPISSFTLTLPEGKFSALAANLPVKANGSFCGQKLVMPTAFRGQNGAEIHESTAITVSGCPKTKKATKRKKPKKASKSSGGKS